VTFVPGTVNNLTASPNPSLPGQSVIFTATLSSVPSGEGTPTGSVTFKDGASVLGTGTLNGSGVATFSTNSLSHGNHVITAEYAGGNLPGSTNSVVQVVNTPPAAGTHYLGATVSTALNISASVLANLDYDADGDALTITAVSSSSTNGGTVSLSSGTITYMPVSGYVGADQFTYTVSDGYLGGTATSTASVTVRLGKATSVIYSASGSGGVMNLVGYGIPGNGYDVQHSTTANFSSYTILASNLIAAPNGVILYTDNSPTNPGFYRLAVH
jgi:hypothetical protein